MLCCFFSFWFRYIFLNYHQGLDQLLIPFSDVETHHNQKHVLYPHVKQFLSSEFFFFSGYTIILWSCSQIFRRSECERVWLLVLSLWSVMDASPGDGPATLPPGIENVWMDPLGKLIPSLILLPPEVSPATPDPLWKSWKAVWRQVGLNKNTGSSKMWSFSWCVDESWCEADF